MTHLPIPANTAEHFYCRTLPQSAQRLTNHEAMLAAGLLPEWAKWVTDQRVAAYKAAEKLTFDQAVPAAKLQELSTIALLDLNTVFPYMVSWYETHEGWLCTTRRFVEGRPAEYGHGAIPERLLDAACCWEGPTPTAALLAMMTERMNAKEMRYGDFGQMVVLKKAFVAA